MHERFDWKVWNFFLALLPAVALYTTMTYARKDMDRLIEEDKSFMVSYQSSSSSSSSLSLSPFLIQFFLPPYSLAATDDEQLVETVSKPFLEYQEIKAS